MNTRFFFTPELVYCNSGFADAISSISTLGGDHRMLVGGSTRIRPSNTRVLVLPRPSFLVRMAMKVSRSRLFLFLRRVFHYQNGPRPDIGSNPLNSRTWMVTELVVLAVQIALIGYTLGVSEGERPIWPMRIWVVGYGIGCVFSLMHLGWRYHLLSLSQSHAQSQNSTLVDVEQQRTPDDSRYSQSIDKYRTYLELFFAIWFVMGNVWVFDSRFGSFRTAPKLHILCISLLAWNAISYSFPFILFVLLCCCVPLVSALLGYNMNMGSVERGATEEQLSDLPSWKYDVGADCSKENDPECCICLANYKEKEEIRQLPCSHTFHLKCVDQWLRIISCCPLCKQELER